MADLTLDKRILQESLKRKRRGRVVARTTRAAVAAPNQRWGMDFIHDRLADGRAFRVFVVLDVFTRECLALVPQPRLRGEDVSRILRELGARRGFPQVIQCDQGTEFTSMAVDHWAYWNRVHLDFSRPATPTDNAIVESFNASLRRECLAKASLSSLTEAEVMLRLWQEDYNNERPHTSLGHRPPAEFRGLTSPAPADHERQIRGA